VSAPPSGPPPRPLSLWKVWAFILVLFAIAAAIAWALVHGSIRRAEERRRAAVEAGRTAVTILPFNG
jgi:hypothetical protein